MLCLPGVLAEFPLRTWKYDLFMADSLCCNTLGALRSQSSNLYYNIPDMSEGPPFATAYILIIVHLQNT